MSKYLLYEPGKFEIKILLFGWVIENSLGVYFFLPTVHTYNLLRIQQDLSAIFNGNIAKLDLVKNTLKLLEILLKYACTA